MFKYGFFGILFVLWSLFIFDYFVYEPKLMELSRAQTKYQVVSREAAQNSQAQLLRDLKDFAQRLGPVAESTTLSFEEDVEVTVERLRKHSIRSLLFTPKITVLGANATRALRDNREKLYGVLLPAEIQVSYPELHQWSYMYFTRLVSLITKVDGLILSKLDMSKNTIRLSVLMYSTGS